VFERSGSRCFFERFGCPSGRKSSSNLPRRVLERDQATERLPRVRTSP
jgi:hypothetical protein